MEIMSKDIAPPVVTAVLAALLTYGCTGRTILDSDAPAPAPSFAPPAVSQAGGEQVHVWFVKPSRKDLTLVAVNRVPGSGDRLHQAVSELLDGPTADESRQGMGSEIPRGTLLLDMKTEGNQVELNLSKRFACGGGTDSLEARIDQLRKTVAEAAGDRKVYLNVEGQRLTQTAGEGLEIPQPLN